MRKIACIKNKCKPRSAKDILLLKRLKIAVIRSEKILYQAIEDFNEKEYSI